MSGVNFDRPACRSVNEVRAAVSIHMVTQPARRVLSRGTRSSSPLLPRSPSRSGITAPPIPAPT